MTLCRLKGMIGNRVTVVKHSKPLSGEQALRGTVLEIRLENGKVEKFDIDAEVSIPDPKEDPELFQIAVRNAPARLAFWNRQSERALWGVRQAEASLKHLRGERFMAYRVGVAQGSFDRPGDGVELEPKEYGVVSSMTEADHAIYSAEVDLNATRRHYGFVRGVRDAVEHRTYVMRKLIGSENE